MQIRTLQGVKTSLITKAFNSAFANYQVKIEMDEKKMQRKLDGDGIDLSLSVGVFDEEQLVGFILHGIVGKLAWNGGTGVIPSYRGRKLTTKMYDFIFPVMEKAGIEDTVLEVIEGNEPAIHLYYKNGFSKTRELECFVGEASIPAKELVYDKVDFRLLDQPDWAQFQAMRSWAPTFQNADPKIRNLGDTVQYWGAFRQAQLLAYLITDADPNSGAIYQFAVAPQYRRKGIATHFFAQIVEQKKAPLRIVNVEDQDESTVAFCYALGLKRPIRQYEMKKKITKTH